jgi:hypothetical protein
MVGLMILLLDARCSRVGGVAQLGEHLLCKQGVIGSIPIVSTTRVCFANVAKPSCPLTAAIVSSETMSAGSVKERVGCHWLPACWLYRGCSSSV